MLVSCAMHRCWLIKLLPKFCNGYTGKVQEQRKLLMVPLDLPPHFFSCEEIVKNKSLTWLVKNNTVLSVRAA